MSKGFTERDYREYLIGLIPSVFKILHLYEEKNEFLSEYIDFLLEFELYGMSQAIGELPKSIWYGKTVGALEGILLQLDSLSDPAIPDNHRKIKKAVLNTTNLIDKQIDRLKGE